MKSLYIAFHLVFSEIFMRVSLSGNGFKSGKRRYK